MYKQASSNNITLDPYPFPSELGMEAYLMDNPSILKLDDRKYGKPQIIECEMSIGKCTNRKTRGRIDMVVRYGEDLFGILELKKHALDKDTLFQLCDYLSEREKIVEAINQSDAVEVDLDPENVKFVGVLVGGYIDDELRKEMPITDLKNNNLLKEHPRQQTIQDLPTKYRPSRSNASAIRTPARSSSFRRRSLKRASKTRRNTKSTAKGATAKPSWCTRSSNAM